MKAISRQDLKAKLDANEHIKLVVPAVNDAVTALLTPEQFDALVSFPFNVGLGRSAGPPCWSGSTPATPGWCRRSSDDGSRRAVGPCPAPGGPARYRGEAVATDQYG